MRRPINVLGRAHRQRVLRRLARLRRAQRDGRCQELSGLCYRRDEWVLGCDCAAVRASEIEALERLFLEGAP